MKAVVPFAPGVVALLLSAAVARPAPAHAHVVRPWPARKPPVEPKPAHQLADIARWPAEPTTPEPVDEARFRTALAHLCNVAEDSEVAALAPDMLAAARENQDDPFLLAALAFHGSSCHADRKSSAGVGLLGIEPTLYFGEGAPPPPVPRAELTQRQLLDPRHNISVGARLLRYWREQHAEIDAAFGSIPHRSEVAHLVWGDDVRSAGQEDLILTARRRMIAAYVGVADQPRPSVLGIPIVSPLETTPRVATSGPGEERDHGARRHRGLDITAAIGEPVRAIADGVVIFAGANVPGHPRKGPIPPDKIGRYARRRLGVGGIYLCVQHQEETAEQKRIVSCYMHLNSYIVADSEHVTAGQTIGYVGRTGVQVSPPHLHLEVRVADRFTNPAKTLGDLVIPPRATMTYRYMLKAKRAKRLRS